jgi:hypothetical protein
MQEDWDAHGLGWFEFAVLEEVKDPALLESQEQYFMDLLGAAWSGYNTLPMAGSFQGYTPDAAARAKIGAASKARWNSGMKEKMLLGHQESDYVFTEEHCRRLSEALRGIPRGVLPDDHRANISAALQGKHPVAATAAWTGRHHTEEAKKKIGLANRGKPCQSHSREMLKARRSSEATKAKISVAMKGRPWSPARRAAYEKLSSDKQGSSDVG